MCSVLRPFMFLRKEIQIPTKVIRDLREVSNLSCKLKWEYAGNVKTYRTINKDSIVFSKPTYVTSRDRASVDVDTIIGVWPSLVSYHTHPCVSIPSKIDYDTSKIFVTLPSKCDFDSYIRGYPNMQVNIICDAHGYYIIDLISAAERNQFPQLHGVVMIMNDFRQKEEIKQLSFSEEGLEYFNTTLNKWKEIVNTDLNQVLNEKLGITVRYYGYEDEAPVVSLDLDSI